MAAGETHRQRGPRASGQDARGGPWLRLATARGSARASAGPRASSRPPRSPIPSGRTKVSRGCASSVPEPPVRPCGRRGATGSGGVRSRSLPRPSSAFGQRLGAPAAPRAELAGAQPRAGGDGGGAGPRRRRIPPGGLPRLRTGRVSSELKHPFGAHGGAPPPRDPPVRCGCPQPTHHFCRRKIKTPPFQPGE